MSRSIVASNASVRSILPVRRRSTYDPHVSEPTKQDEPQDDSKSGRFSLQNLSAAFARLTGAAPTEGDEPASSDSCDQLDEESPLSSSQALSPRMIVEGMLFVGKEDGQPLSSREMASHIRDVSPQEVESLIDELNEGYQQSHSPYRIESAGKGFRFVLHADFEPVRQRFFGRTKEAKLTPQAIEVLSVVAYRQPIDAEEVTRLRGGRSHSQLNNLVRRGLLRIDRPNESPRKPIYSTTDRFNALFRIDSPRDLPNSEELDDC